MYYTMSEVSLNYVTRALSKVSVFLIIYVPLCAKVTMVSLEVIQTERADKQMK